MIGDDMSGKMRRCIFERVALDSVMVVFLLIIELHYFGRAMILMFIILHLDITRKILAFFSVALAIMASWYMSRHYLYNYCAFKIMDEKPKMFSRESLTASVLLAIAYTIALLIVPPFFFSICDILSIFVLFDIIFLLYRLRRTDTQSPFTQGSSSFWTW